MLTWIRRLWRELRTRSLKCERVGHNVWEYKQTAYLTSFGDCVCVLVTRRRLRCRRCHGWMESEWHNETTHGYQGATFPESYWEHMREKGAHVREAWWYKKELSGGWKWSQPVPDTDEKGADE